MPFAITNTVSEDDRHLKDVTTIIFHRGKLYSGGDDGIIKVWNADLQKISQIQAHEVNVYHMVANDDTLYSCSNDGTIKAWFTENLQHKKTLLTCDDEVYRLYVDGNRLYSGDSKGMIGIFEDDTCQQMSNFVEEVSDLIVRGNLIYTVRDRDLVINEAIPGKNGSRFVTKADIEGRCPMAIVGTRLCFASRTGVDIHIHNNSLASRFTEEFKFEKAHDLIVIAMCGDQNHTLYTGGWDKILKCWDLEKKECVGSCDVGCYINALCVAPEGQIYAAGANGFLCRIEKCT